MKSISLLAIVHLLLIFKPYAVNCEGRIQNSPSFSSTDHSEEDDTQLEITDPPIKRKIVEPLEASHENVDEENDPEWEKSVFEKIQVPMDGPYYKPTILDSTTSLQRSRSASHPQSVKSSDDESTLKRSKTMLDASDTTEVKKRLKLQISPERAKEDYRFLGNDAEGAFITRYYGFVNQKGNRNYVNGFISQIEDYYKNANKLEIQTGPVLPQNFNNWDEKQKSYFCDTYITQNVLLAMDGISYDKKNSQQIRKVDAAVTYTHESLKRYKIHDEVEIILCPCLEDRQSLMLGFLPLYYLDRRDAPYEFIYKSTGQVDKFDRTIVEVWGLGRIDRKKSQELRATLLGLIGL